MPRVYTPTRRRSQTHCERFFEKVAPPDERGCWLWTAAKNPQGYGVLRISGRRNWLAHRLSWVLHRGPIPDGAGYHGTCVLHRCDVTSCVNPGHLWLGTNADNIADKVAKGRQSHGGGSPKSGLRGEAHLCAKLTADDVREIRRRWPAETPTDLAPAFGVLRSAIYHVVHRRTWKHIE